MFDDMTWGKIRRLCDRGITPVYCGMLKHCTDDDISFVKQVSVLPPSGVVPVGRKPELSDYTVLMCENQHDDLIPVSVVAGREDDGTVVVVICQLAEGTEEIVPGSMVELDEQGLVRCSPETGRIAVHNLPDNPFCDTTLFSNALYCLALMNLRNVVLRDAEAPRYVRRRHEKDGSATAIRYKMLALNGSLLDTPKRLGNGPAYTPLHKVRAHVRYYGHQRKMFGRLTGWFLVPPHVRGNPQFGEVRKGYRIERTPEES